MEKEKELEINEAEAKAEEVVEEAATEKVEETTSAKTIEEVKEEAKEETIEAAPALKETEEPKAENGKEPIIQLKNVDITFGKFKSVKNATFDIYKGETFSLVGESGSGKTTIGRAIIRINPISSGEILFNGKRISGKISKKEDRDVIRNIQMIFQDPAASLNERATVEYIVSEGLYNFHLFENDADRIRKVENIIKEVGLLPEHLTRYPHEFSGGQRQRIGIARSIVMEPKFVIADEPISALDVSIRAQVLNLLKKFQKELDITYLFIAHDLSIVRFISDRIGVIYKGDMVEIAETEELFAYPLHPYTKSLLSAIPVPDPKIEKNKKLFVYDPSLHDYSEDKPSLRDIGHNHLVFCNNKEFEEYKKIRN
ncbi:MAG: ATP-binding cassette domain-containing protein [Acholeplasmatales bacterium]|nr:ATP-binding cassette domain-containing protein [Acholeplasmatales bacterium]